MAVHVIEYFGAAEKCSLESFDVGKMYLVLGLYLNFTNLLMVRDCDLVAKAKEGEAGLLGCKLMLALPQH